MNALLFPSLYQVNTRTWITALSEKLGKQATLDDIPDHELDLVATLGFDWIWFLSVWQTGQASRNVSITNPAWRKGFEETLPDLKEEDIAGSGFAITGYTVHQTLGGDEALHRLRMRLQKRGLKLMLDFVPNHVALDHPWLTSHPDYFISGTEDDLSHAPQNFVRIKQNETESIFAYGRDPYFGGWTDTLQLNYGNMALQEAMIRELIKISGQCDGVRSDMAMLVLPDVFERTWGIKCQPFWTHAIPRVKESQNGFVFMAEVYWDLEWTLQQQGFDFTYDKRLYDRLREGHARPVLGHLHADLGYQNKSARFLENHDEPRAASAFFREMHEAAAVITYLTPGMRFFHQGQFEGRKKRISPHLVRAPQEAVDENLNHFYISLLNILKRAEFRTGTWKLLECSPGWEGNDSYNNFIAFAWESPGNESVVVVVNYSSNQSQCHLKMPFADLENGLWRFEDLFTPVQYDWNAIEQIGKGMYFDEPGWKFYVFRLTKAPGK